MPAPRLRKKLVGWVSSGPMERFFCETFARGVVALVRMDELKGFIFAAAKIGALLKDLLGQLHLRTATWHRTRSTISRATADRFRPSIRPPDLRIQYGPRSRPPRRTTNAAVVPDHMRVVFAPLVPSHADIEVRSTGRFS
jgi:hypothetical protein